MIGFDTSLLSILLLPMLGGIGLACTSGLLGCFIVWRRMAYFGDTLAHSSLLGVTLGTLVQVSPTLGVIATSLLVALLLALLQKGKQLADDTILGIMSHGSLALGLILLSAFPIPGQSLHNLLLGDLVTLGPQDVINISIFSVIFLGGAWFFWRPLTSWIIDEELALVEGHSVNRLRYGLMFAIALFIALSMQFVGVLLITALLITPAASARLVAKSPEQMAIFSILYALFATIVGTLICGSIDWPLGPSIVLTASLGFGITFLARRGR